MITIPCSCRNGSRVPPLWWGYSAPDWGHVHCTVPQLTERNSVHPPQITKIQSLKSGWLSRGHIWAPWIFDNVLTESPQQQPLYVQELLTGSQGLKPCCSAQSVSRDAFVCGTIPGPSPSATNALADSSAGKLLSFQPAATGQAFPSGKYLNKVCTGRYPRSVPSVLQNIRTFLTRGHCMCVCVFICVHIFRYTHKYFTPYFVVNSLPNRELW